MKLFYSAVLCCALLISCGNAKEEYPATVTEKDGIKTISNPDYPKEGAYDLMPEEKFTLGKEESNSQYLFGIPVEIALDSKNNLYVLDYGNNNILAFDNNGKFLKTVGRKGNGPGDFELPAYFQISTGDKIIINDSRNARICYLDLNGKYLGGAAYKSFHSTLKLDSKNNVYITESKEPPDSFTPQWRPVTTTEIIKKFDAGGKNLTAIGSFPGSTIYQKRNPDGMLMSRSSENSFWWNIAPSDKIITGATATYEFTYSDLSGKILYKVTRKFSPAVNRDYNEKANESRYLSAFTCYTIVDDKGYLWVNVNNGDKPDYYIYDVFSEEGIFLKQIYSKYTFNLIKGDMAYFITHPGSGEEPIIKGMKFSLKKRIK